MNDIQKPYNYLLGLTEYPQMLNIYKTGEAPYPDYFPPKKFLIDDQVQKQAQASALKTIVEAGASETEVDQFLRKNPGLVGACMNFTQFGHHGTWVVPQQQVRPPFTENQPGLKPDYIVGGKSSDGFRWLVVELKGGTAPLFVEKKGGRLSLSAIANEGICQLLGYVEYCTKAQAYLREQLKLTDFTDPQGLLIIGQEDELKCERRRTLRHRLNTTLAGRIQIRTYHALVRSTSSTWTEVRAEAWLMLGIFNHYG